MSDKPQYVPAHWYETALQDANKLRARLTEAAAFLDGLADKLDPHATYMGLFTTEAADCRAMAAKLRGET